MDIEQFRNQLPINKHRLDDALEVQAELQERISAEVARLHTRMLEAKQDLARIDAGLLQDIKDGPSRITKDVAEAQIVRNRLHRDAWAHLQACREELETWQGLLASWERRGKDIDAMGRLFGAQYFTMVSVIGAPSRERPRIERQDYTEERPRRRSRED